MTVNIEALARDFISRLPEQTRAEHIQALRDEDRAKWLAGDRAVEWLDEFPDLPQAVIREAVAIEFHLTSSTVRDRERMARLVDDALRDAHPLLTFHLWRACSMNGGRTEDTDERMSQMLDMVVQVEEYAEAYGHLPTVSQVYGWSLEDGTDPRPVWMLRSESVLDIIDKLRLDEQTPAGVQAFVGLYYDGLSSLLQGRDIIVGGYRFSLDHSPVKVDDGRNNGLVLTDPEDI